jgi:ribosomal protein S18 acetylase RimI-like enzyme
MKELPSHIIRKATLKDILFFYNAFCTLYNKQFDINKFNVQYKAKLKSKEYHLLVIELTHSAKIVGCSCLQQRVLLFELDEFLEIQSFFITPEYRKLKAADFLYEGIELLANTLGIPYVQVSCNVNSTLNQNFYTKKGYKISKKQYQKIIF